MTKTLVLFSGGVDSTAALLHALNKSENVQLLTFRYGDERRQFGEISTAMRLSAKYGLPHSIIDLPIPYSAYPITNQPFCQHYERKDPLDDVSKYGVLPFNVALNLLFASSHGALNGCTEIVWGSIKDEAEITSDFRQDYMDKLNAVLHASGSVNTKVSVSAPLVNTNKWDIVSTYFENDPELFSDTWSCKNSTNHIQCGICYGCDGRRLAAEIAGIDDKTKYADNRKNHNFDDDLLHGIKAGRIKDTLEVSEFLRGSGKGNSCPNC